jgi:hypothetical protein
VLRVVLVASLAWSATVRADPDDLVSRPIVLAPGQLEAELVAEIDAAPTYFAKPFSLAPDAWYGVTDRLTIGIVNSHLAVDRYDPGASLCSTTAILECDHVYSGSGLDARYLVQDGALAVAPRLRLLVRDVAPWKPAVAFGGLARWTSGRYAIVADPYLQFGLANVELGNRAQLFVPLAFDLQPARRWLVELRTGYNSELDVLSSGYYIPVWFGVTFAATAHFDVGVAAGFETLLGPLATSKARQGYFIVDWRS